MLFYLGIVAIILLFLQHRSRLLFYVILLTLHQSFFLRMKLKTILITGGLAFTSFMLATFMRASSMFDSLEKSFFFILNYFDTYDMLVLSVRDFPQAVTFKTTFMAFNKFITPVGNSEGVYYHMSYWLTQKYFSDSGVGYRTSFQWPIETDMYISFAYVYGIPLIALYFFIVGYVYRLALTSRSLGAMYVSVVVNLHIFSHLRGALITFVDIYLIPLLFISYYLLNKARFINK